ncbi:hypothetical protein KP509_28G041000 [Ceratopteris richardii]|uniref:Uncharacterized protein n=1 Tax=Ceratopteris richardii TaxID=49495 RepID=A0A8T2RDZ0_CERRI|nr:hypothetical protein KP509_28G041000 [Ceratopteris richardii]
MEDSSVGTVLLMHICNICRFAHACLLHLSLFLCHNCIIALSQCSVYLAPLLDWAFVSFILLHLLSTSFYCVYSSWSLLLPYCVLCYYCVRAHLLSTSFYCV